MKYLKTYKKLFETYHSYDKDSIEDIKELIQMDIIDEFNIPMSDVLQGDYDPQCIINNISEEESIKIIEKIATIRKRIYNISGYFIKVFYKKNIQKITLDINYLPGIIDISDKFNLELTTSDNSHDIMDAVYCDYETVFEIIDYLNSFYQFVYRTEIDLFKKSYETLNELYNVKLKFSIVRFEDKQFMQYIAVEFELSDKVKKVTGKYNPVFVINNNHTKSPYIWKRDGNSSWKLIPNDIDKYLKTEQF